MNDAVDVALRLGEGFDRIGIAYFLGGSLASSLQGEPRATNDIDFVVDLRKGQVAELAKELGPDFDVDTEALEEAATRRSSWNLYYLPFAMKIDLFILKTGPFDLSEFSRRGRVELAPGKSLAIKSPEDTVLRKLLWYRAGGETSSTQWRDVVQVLKVGRDRIDQSYLDRWAGELGVSDLLARVREEAARP
jgi:hypothetical protein